MQDDIQKQGFYIARIKRGTIFQKIKFTLQDYELVKGKVVKILKSDKPLTADECQKVAEQTNYPVFSKISKAVPRGKKLSDFLR